jgi:hypothetical protein
MTDKITSDAQKLLDLKQLVGSAATAMEAHGLWEEAKQLEVVEKELEDIAARLASPPAGWVVVPRMPTHKMKVQGLYALDEVTKQPEGVSVGNLCCFADMGEAYKAMIAAAPGAADGAQGDGL